MAATPMRGVPGTEARNKFTGEVIGKFDVNGHFVSAKKIATLVNAATPESRARGRKKSHETQLKNGHLAAFQAKGVQAKDAPAAVARRDFKKMARDVLDRIIDECGDDVVEGAKQMAKLARGEGAESAMEKIAAFKAISDLVLNDLKKAANVGGTHTTNNILISSEDKTNRFLSAFGDRGREMVAVQSGDQAGAVNLPVGLPAGPVQRDDDSQASGDADGVAEVDHLRGGEQPGVDGGADEPPG